MIYISYSTDDKPVKMRGMRLIDIRKDFERRGWKEISDGIWERKGVIAKVFAA